MVPQWQPLAGREGSTSEPVEPEAPLEDDVTVAVPPEEPVEALVEVPEVLEVPEVVEAPEVEDAVEAPELLEAVVEVGSQPDETGRGCPEQQAPCTDEHAVMATWLGGWSSGVQD